MRPFKLDPALTPDHSVIVAQQVAVAAPTEVPTDADLDEQEEESMSYHPSVEHSDSDAESLPSLVEGSVAADLDEASLTSASDSTSD